MTKGKYSRRDFLRIAAAGTCGAAIHTALTPGFKVTQYANAQSAAAKHLFVINLAGGCSYNIAPIYASAWRDKNPTISYGPGDSLTLTDVTDQGLHPSLTYFQELFDDGDLALMNQVGFQQRASRSHDVAAQMWMTGSIEPNGKNGILNNLSCRIPGTSLFRGISFAGSDPIVEGSCAQMRKLESLSGLEGSAFGNHTNFNGADETAWINIQRKKLLALGTKESNISRDYVKSAIKNMDDSAEEISETLDGATLPNVGFAVPAGGFGNDITDAMKVLQSSNVLGTNIFYLETGGFDTHSGERMNLANRLTPLNQGVRYIAEVSKALGVWDDVMILIFSEFARTFENSAQGTDHGEVAPCFLMGGSVNGRQVNSAPTNSKILSSNSFLRSAEIDTRRVWYNIISQGLGLTPSGILDSSGYSTASLNLFT